MINSPPAHFTSSDSLPLFLFLGEAERYLSHLSYFGPKVVIMKQFEPEVDPILPDWVWTRSLPAQVCLRIPERPAPMKTGNCCLS